MGRIFILFLCAVSLAGCGWLNRVPGMNKSPRVVVTQNETTIPASAMAFAPMPEENTPY